MREAAIEEAGSGWVRAQITLACTYSPELVQGQCGFIKEGILAHCSRTQLKLSYLPADLR